MLRTYCNTGLPLWLSIRRNVDLKGFSDKSFPDVIRNDSNGNSSTSRQHLQKHVASIIKACWLAASRIIVNDVIELIVNFESIRIFDSPQHMFFRMQESCGKATVTHQKNGIKDYGFKRKIGMRHPTHYCITLHLTFIQIWYFMFVLIRKPFMIKSVLLLHPIHSKHMWFDHSYDNNVSLYPALFTAIHQGFCGSLKLKARLY